MNNKAYQPNIDNTGLPPKGNEILHDVSDKIEKPPLGIMPKKLWIEFRRNEIIEAIIRYSEALKEIPQEWVDELNEHCR